MKEVLVVGDTITDIDIFSEAVGLSLESPTLKSNFINKKSRLGGAANLVNHLCNFSKEIDFFTSANNDSINNLNDMGVNTINLQQENYNSKTRYWIQKGDSIYKYLQINNSIKMKNDIDVFTEFKKKINVNNYSKIIVSDYSLGIVNSEIANYISSNSSYCIGASQTSDRKSNFGWFENFDFLVCNEFESLSIKKKSNLCITLGSKGCKIGNIDYPTKKIDTQSAIGAGDAFLAAFSMTNDPNLANNYAREFLENNIVEFT